MSADDRVKALPGHDEKLHQANQAAHEVGRAAVELEKTRRALVLACLDGEENVGGAESSYRDAQRWFSHAREAYERLGLHE